MLSVLPPEQLALWPRLGPLRDLGMVLYGGTAVALRCGHRQSVDFDFFGPQPLDKDALWRELPLLSEGRVIRDEFETKSIQSPAWSPT
ncbi:MAG: hypothetical protein HKL82_02845 [Acidimicrobiaceae bacterium]|nr:hypothetical protein [Acidimicrobiaceae bacterium]